MINGVTLKIKRLQKIAATLLVAVLLGACEGVSGGHIDSGVARHVFLIVMEKQSAKEALTGQFTASLAAKYGVATNYRAITHPSVPNYLALTSGSTWGVTDDSYHTLPKQDLGTQLTSAGVAWRAYMEGLGDGGCPSNVVPLASFAGDLAGSTPQFSWITPDRCHDTHDCSVATGDDWLKQTVEEITRSSAWKHSGVLFITWDEDDSSASNQVLTLVVTPSLGHRASNRAYDHYSLLATIEDIMGIGRLGHAAEAQPMNDLVG